MKTHLFDRPDIDNAWCPGCGNFPILKLLKALLEELGYAKEEVVIVSGIGQAAKTPYYIDTHMFGGLHGRALPVATAVKAANPNLKVIAEGGDGDMYGEGGNHFLHAIRRNVGLLHLVHDNMVYGLTKGQASPTSRQGFQTPVQVDGVGNIPFNPIAIALASGAGFVARVNIGNYDHAKAVLKAAFKHQGYALVDILQPCVTFNTINTYEWFKAHTVELDASHDRSDRAEAIKKALENDPMPLGIFYQCESETFEQRLWRGREGPLHACRHDMAKLQELFNRFS